MWGRFDFDSYWTFQLRTYCTGNENGKAMKTYAVVKIPYRKVNYFFVLYFDTFGFSLPYFLIMYLIMIRIRVYPCCITCCTYAIISSEKFNPLA